MSDPPELLLSVLCDHVIHSSPLPNYLASDVLMQPYSYYRSFHKPHCRNQSPFFLPYGIPIFASYKVGGKTMLLKRFSHRIFSSFALSTSFIVINSSPPPILLSTRFTDPCLCTCLPFVLRICTHMIHLIIDCELKKTVLTSFYKYLWSFFLIIMWRFIFCLSWRLYLLKIPFKRFYTRSNPKYSKVQS